MCLDKTVWKRMEDNLSQSRLRLFGPAQTLPDDPIEISRSLYNYQTASELSDKGGTGVAKPKSPSGAAVMQRPRYSSVGDCLVLVTTRD